MGETIGAAASAVLVIYGGWLVLQDLAYRARERIQSALPEELQVFDTLQC